MSKPVTIPIHHRELLRGAEVAAVLGIGLSKFHRLKRDELLPSPVVLDGIPMWRRRELIDWVGSGCPCLAEWRWEPGHDPAQGTRDPTVSGAH
jgi:predicted DNA-binding transcriptional regulator AlpA